MNEPIELAPSFASLGLPQELCTVVQGLGYEMPTPVQSRSIPILLSGRDFIGQAQTGTGKTAAFALPLLGRIDFATPGTQILVLTPTRELAIQVSEAFKSYSRGVKNFKVVPIYGGQSMLTQFHQLDRKPQVIVGTPGRIMDHLRRKTLSLSSLSALVIDEADEMLSMGFIEDIQWIMEQTPAEKQIALFSATMPPAIRAIAQKYLKNPLEVVIEQTVSTSDLISQWHWTATGPHKLDALVRILEVDEVDGVLIFMRTKTATIELAEQLEAHGHSAGALNGDMSQEARERTVERFKRGKLDVLVATDVAARGLDIDRISHVINYDIPFDIQTYTHRIGRTGRAGRTGTAISFITPREGGLLRSIERGAGKKIPPYKMPTKEDLANRRIDRFVAKVETALKHSKLKSFGTVLETVVEKTKVPMERVASALCVLLSNESPLFVEGPDLVVENHREAERSNEEYRRRVAHRNEGRKNHREGRRKFRNEGRPGLKKDRGAWRKKRQRFAGAEKRAR